MGFLHYLDVMIGYALGMAVLSTLIGTASGGWLTLIRSRTRHMRSGLASLIQNVGSVTETESRALSRSIMMDDTVKARNLSDWLKDPTDLKSIIGRIARFVRSFSAETIQREELVLIVLRKASEGSISALKALGHDTSSAVQHEAELRSLSSKISDLEKELIPLQDKSEKSNESTLMHKSIEDTLKGLSTKEAELLAASRAGLGELKKAATEQLRKVEETILSEEVDAPDLPAQVWRTKALAAVVPAMASRVFSQFDNMMDRLEDNVGDSGKVASVVFAAIFLSFYPVDSIAMLTRLSTSDELRAKAITAAQKVDQEQEQKAKKTDNHAPSPAPTADRQAATPPPKPDESKSVGSVAETKQADQEQKQGAKNDKQAAPSSQASTTEPQTTTQPPRSNEARSADSVPEPTSTEPLGVSQELQSGLFGEVLRETKGFRPIDHLFANPGVLLTWVMVSMGAPFWLNQLSKLLGLKSEMARKATEQRNLRDKDLRPVGQK